MPSSLYLLLLLVLFTSCSAFRLITSTCLRRLWKSYLVHSGSGTTSLGVASELPEKEPDDSFLDELDEKIQQDRELELKMARQLFDDLKGDDPLLSKEKFVVWEDIDELLSRGAFDGETLEIIYTECGVSGADISFEQFIEIVDLVNQVSAVLDQDLQSVLNADIDTVIVDDDTEDIEDDLDLGLPGIDLSWMPKSIQ